MILFVMAVALDRKSTRLNSSYSQISYAVFCLKKKKPQHRIFQQSRSNLDGNFLGTELTEDSKHLGHLCGSRRRPLRWMCRHDGDDLRDHTRIERIALGKDYARPRQ